MGAEPSQIAVYDDALEAETCRLAIHLFQQEEKTVASARYALARGAFEPFLPVEQEIAEARRGQVVVCGQTAEWLNLRKAINAAAERHLRRFAADHPGIASLCEEHHAFTVPRFEMIEEGGGFDWHMDSRHVQDDRRFLTFVFYLNDVDSGGETEFLYTGERVVPRAGRLLMLPPFWTHIHRGNSPIGAAKYTASLFATRI